VGGETAIWLLPAEEDRLALRRRIETLAARFDAPDLISSRT
jgi:hypothetical protein